MSFVTRAEAKYERRMRRRERRHLLTARNSSLVVTKVNRRNLGYYIDHGWTQIGYQPSTTYNLEAFSVSIPAEKLRERLGA